MDLFLSLTKDGADLELVDGDLRVDRGLRTAVLLSLFADRRIADDERLPGHRDPEDLELPGVSPRLPRDLRGWWADRDGDLFGSRLWLLGRAKLTSITIDLARQYAEEALAWLVDEGIAEAVEVRAERLSNNLSIDVRIHRGRARRWDELWRETGGSFDLQQDGLRIAVLAS